MTSYTSEEAESVRLLKGLEEGALSTVDAYDLARERDPVIIHFVIQFLRAKYPPNSVDSEGVLQRVVELTSTYPDIVKKAKEGENDPITEWFQDAHELREYFDNPEELVNMLVDKIES